MAIEEGELTLVEANTLPDAVPDEERAVENGDLGVVAVEELAVDPDLDVGVAGVGNR